MVCRKCKLEKEQSLMVNHPTDKICKDCQKQYNKKRNKLYYEKNKKIILEKYKEKINNNFLLKQKIKQYNQIYNQINAHKLKKQKFDNKEKYMIKQKEYYQKNKEIIIKKNKEYNKYYYVNNIQYKLSLLLRSNLNDFLKKNKTNKSKSALILLNCTIEDCKLYLEKQFKPEMNWENHGKIWEIDHIKPCSSFDLTKEEEQQKCFHYTNLQPLFKTTEIAKQFGYENEVGNRNKSNIY